MKKTRSAFDPIGLLYIVFNMGNPWVKNVVILTRIRQYPYPWATGMDFDGFCHRYRYGYATRGYGFLFSSIITHFCYLNLNFCYFLSIFHSFQWLWSQCHMSHVKLNNHHKLDNHSNYHLKHIKNDHYHLNMSSSNIKSWRRVYWMAMTLRKGLNNARCIIQALGVFYFILFFVFMS